MNKTFDERLKRYYGMSNTGRYINSFDLYKSLIYTNGVNISCLERITSELCEERFKDLIRVLFPTLKGLEDFNDIDLEDFTYTNGYVECARLLRLRDSSLGVEEAFNKAKEIDKELKSLHSMYIEVTYSEPPVTGFGIKSYDAHMKDGSVITFDFKDVYTTNNGDKYTSEYVATIVGEYLDTDSFPDSKNLDIREIKSIHLNFEEDDYNGYGTIEKINFIECISKDNSKVILEQH